MKKLCSVHGVYSTAKCPACENSRHRVYSKMYRNREYDKFYKSYAWQKVRKLQLKKHPLCVICARPGVIVDHIIEIRDGGKKLDLENLQTMCRACHNKKTAKEKKERGAMKISTTPRHQEPTHWLFLTKTASWVHPINVTFCKEGAK